MLSDSIGLEFDSTGLKRQFKTKAHHDVPFPGIYDLQVVNSAYWDDSSGLIAYHDGVKLYDGEHRLVADMGQLERYTVGSLLLPYNANADSLILFRNGINNRMTYSVIGLDSSKRKVSLKKKDINISSDTFCDKFAAIKHANNRDWWVITHQFGNNVFWVLLVANGRIERITKIPIGASYLNYVDNKGFFQYRGYLNVNSFHNKIVSVTIRGAIDVFDFDNCTGVLSNHLALRAPRTHYPYPVGKYPKTEYFGCSFSPNDRFVYVNCFKYLLQYDLQAPDPSLKAETLFFLDRDYPRDKGIDYWNGIYGLFQHYVGKDGKIYLYKTNYNYLPEQRRSPFDSTLAVIHEPNQKGKACRFELNAIPLQFGARTKAGMYAPTYSDDEPLKANATLSDTVVCPGDSVRFFNNSCGQIAHLWDFGAEKDTALNPVKVFTQPGIYKIRLLLTTYRPAGITPLELSVRVKDCLKVETETQIIPTDTCGQLGVQFKIQLKQGKPDFIQWNFDDGNQSYEPNPYHLYRSAGTYIPKLTVSNKENVFTKYFDKVTVEPCPEQTEDFKLYPNPNTGSFTVEYKPLNDTDLELFNVLGQRIARFSLPAHLKKPHLRLEAVSAGVYFYRLKSNQTGKLIIY